MFLEAVEDFGRGYHPGKKEFAGMRVPRATFHIEHIMPRRWELHWPRPVAVSAQDRNHSIQTLGNLTLLTARPNSSVSNGAWSGKDGKRAAMARHDVLLLNSDLSEYSTKGWNDSSIGRRTEAMALKLVEIWAVPDGYKASTARDTKGEHRTVEISDLLSADLLTVGQKLYAKSHDLRDRTATIFLMAVSTLTAWFLKVRPVQVTVCANVRQMGGASGWLIQSRRDPCRRFGANIGRACRCRRMLATKMSRRNLKLECSLHKKLRRTVDERTAW